jgi:hypothetical protein
VEAKPAARRPIEFEPALSAIAAWLSLARQDNGMEKLERRREAKSQSNNQLNRHKLSPSLVSGPQIKLTCKLRMQKNLNFKALSRK